MSVSDTRCSESSGRTETSGAGGFPSSLLLCRTAAMVCASSSCSLTAGAAKSEPMICVMSMKSPALSMPTNVCARSSHRGAAVMPCS